MHDGRVFWFLLCFRTLRQCEEFCQFWRLFDALVWTFVLRFVELIDDVVEDLLIHFFHVHDVSWHFLVFFWSSCEFFTDKKINQDCKAMGESLANSLLLLYTIHLVVKSIMDMLMLSLGAQTRVKANKMGTAGNFEPPSVLSPAHSSNLRAASQR